MIRSFRDPRTEALFNDQDVPRYRTIERVARRSSYTCTRRSALTNSRSRPATGWKP